MRNMHHLAHRRSKLESVHICYAEKSEILAKVFADMGEKRGENLAKNFAGFVLQFPGKVAARNFTKKSSTSPTSHETKFLHRETLGAWGEGRRHSKVRRPLKTTFDMTTLTFSTGASPRTLLIPLIRGAPGSRSSWLVTEKPFQEVATKDHSSLNTSKRNPELQTHPNFWDFLRGSSGRGEIPRRRESCNLCRHPQRCQMPDIDKSQKTAERGAKWVPGKAPAKQLKNSRKNSQNNQNSCFSGVSDVLLAVFRLFDLKIALKIIFVVRLQLQLQ